MNKFTAWLKGVVMPLAGIFAVLALALAVMAGAVGAAWFAFRKEEASTFVELLKAILSPAAIVGGVFILLWWREDFRVWFNQVVLVKFGKFEIRRSSSPSERDSGNFQDASSNDIKGKADGEDPQALKALAVKHTSGRGVEKSHEKAFALYQRAAELGDPEAISIVGQLLYIGRGTEKNTRKACEYFKEAAWLGDGDAQFNFAVAHIGGEVIPENFREAYIWFDCAAKNGIHEAQERRNLVGTCLFPNALSNARDDAERRREDIQRKLTKNG